MNRAIAERLLGHNVWATRVLLERCRSLTAGQLTQTFDIGPGSLHDTPRHVVGAMHMLRRPGENDLPDVDAIAWALATAETPG